jgi:hypothetical protein
MIPESRNLLFQDFENCAQASDWNKETVHPSTPNNSAHAPKIPDAALSLYSNFLESPKQANSEKNEASAPKTGSLACL